MVAATEHREVIKREVGGRDDCDHDFTRELDKLRYRGDNRWDDCDVRCDECLECGRRWLFALVVTKP